MPDPETNPFRIRIGVTGHRRLNDPAALQVLVKQAIDAAVERLCPEKSRWSVEGSRQAESAALPLRVMSPLAEGADRVVARAVLAFPDARLDAVLPLVLEDYLEDFTTEESRKEFEDLLGRCSNPICLRTRRIRDESSDPPVRQELRNDAYMRAGRYVVDHCDMLIAVWNGEPANGNGGTAQVVRYALELSRPVIRVWADSLEWLN
jgi:hypothetical protein